MRLPNLLGSARLKEALAPLLPGELGQAVLLDGPRGVGKHTAARDLSMALLCQKGAMAPCGVCPACRRVLAEEYPVLTVSVTLPDEQFRRVGQSMAAASLPTVSLPEV